MAPGSRNTAQDAEEISADIRLGSPDREAQGTYSLGMFCFKAWVFVADG